MIPLGNGRRSLFFPLSFHWPAPRFRRTATGKTSSFPKTDKTGQEIRVEKKHERISNAIVKRPSNLITHSNNSSNNANIVKTLKTLNPTENSEGGCFA